MKPWITCCTASTNGKGFIAITGGVGTGKTTLCRALLDHLDENTKSALIFSSFVSHMEILKSIAHEFGIPLPVETESKNALLDAINHFLLGVFREGGNALLLIDEAQNLSRTVLEQIRMLSNLETEKDKLIQIVLVGQSELKAVLSAHSLRQLDDRITVRYHLKPLDQKDAAGVRGASSGGGGRKGGCHLFPWGFQADLCLFREAIRGGSTRSATGLSLLAYTAEKRTVSGKMAGRAILDLRGGMDAGEERRPGSRRWPWWKWALPLVFFLMIAAGLGIFVFMDHFIYSGTHMKTEALSVPSVKVRPDLPLFLTNKESIAGLFDLTEAVLSSKNENGNIQMSLVSFPLRAEYYTLLKKPFRIEVPESTDRGIPEYLLVDHITAEGAVIMDADGKRQNVTRNFILKHWGGQAAWVYPYGDNGFFLKQGMRSPAVLTLQEILKDLGFLVTLNGIFDQQTLEEVKRFQDEFGLDADGVVGFRTLTLLYQMADKAHELHP